MDTSELSQLIQLSIDGHLVCFYILTIVNSGPVNRGVQKSFQVIVFVFFPEVKLLGHMVALSFPGSSAGKESVYNTRDLGLIPGLGRAPRGGYVNPL